MMFSVVIANYNSGLYIENAINSLLNQTYNDFEIIIIDGGSTDNSLDVIKKYDNKISYWISEKDRGQSDAFNKGFSVAKGDYYIWLNADDLLMPNALKEIRNHILKCENYKWFVFNTIIIDKYDKILRTINGPKWSRFLVDNYGPQVDSATSVFHQSVFHNSGKFDLNLHYAMDVDLWLQFIRNGFKYRRINKYLYCFRVHENSKTTNLGYKTKPNKDRILQSEYIKSKNNFKPNIFGKYIALLNKMFFCKPQSIYYTYIWKNKTVNQIL